MVIVYRTAKLGKEFNEEKLLLKRYGARRAELLKRRLTQLKAVDNLEDLRKMPQLRCHELKGNRKGQLSVDVDHPYRLIFESANNPLPKKPDGGLDWTKVTEIMIIGVEDTHE
jgi:proteic killer suppression protein